MRTLTNLLPKHLIHAAICTGVAIGLTWNVGMTEIGFAQDADIIPTSGSLDPVIPTSYAGAGSFFNSNLGTAFRINYHTQGYGTQEGIVSLGAMKVIDHGGATTFFDGQGTLSDEFGGGFNAGVGYRWMQNSFFGPDPQRITGFNFFTDGQSTSADNFFTQLGVGWESLGDIWDFRANGYFPLERTKVGASTVTGTGLFFLGDALVGDTIDTTVDTALTVVDGELARRIADLEAWAFVGGYHLEGGPVDTDGYRAGVRGYAVPDLALSLQVTDDNLYHTNVMFGITWFVGRTNKCNVPCGTLADRFREPVLRNNFISTAQRVIAGVGGDPMTSQSTGAAFDFVHVDDSAPAGGDGTIENPVNSLAAAETIGVENSIYYVHSGSNLSGGITLLDGQQVLGEGVDAGGVDPVNHFVDTVQRGTVLLPESSPGASTGAMPTIAGAGDVFTLANNNSINNFTVTGGARAIFADGSAAPQLQNLQLNNQTGDTIVLTEATGTPVLANTVNITDAGGTGLVIDGGDTTFSPNANITNSAGQSLEIRNRTDGTIAYGGDIIDTGAGILIEDNMGGVINFTADSKVNLNVSGADTALTISDNEGASITFNDLAVSSTGGDGVSISGGGTVSILDTNGTSSIANTGAGDAVSVFGAPNGDAAVTIAAGISNSTGGRAVDIQQMASNGVTISETVTVTSGGGVNADSNTGAILSFNGLDITATTGDGFTATGGGTLAVTGTNVIDTSGGTGDGLELDGMTIDAAGATFDNVTVNGATNGVILKDLTGGLVTVGSGTNPGDGGTMTTTLTAISIDNVESASINNVTVNNTAGTGLSVRNNGNAAGNISVNGLDVTTSTGTAALVDDNGGATIVVDNLKAETTGGGDALRVTDNTGGSISFIGTTGTDVDTAMTGPGITVAGNSAPALISFQNMNVQTTSGAGFSASGAGELTVSGTNIINSTGGGTSLSLDGSAGLTIGSGGARFSSVSSSGGATNAIVLNELSGGPVNVDGGMIDGTTGDGIVVTNSSNVAISGVTINNAGANAVNATNSSGAAATLNLNNLTINDATTNGVSITDSGTAAFNVNVNTMNIDGTVGDAVKAENTSTASSTLNLIGLTVDNIGAAGVNVAHSGASNYDVNVTSLTVNGVGSDAVVVDHTSDNLLDMDIQSLNVNSATDSGVVATANGAGLFDLLINNSDIDGVGQKGVLLTTGVNSDRVNFTLTNNNEIVAGDDNAFAADLAGGTGDVRFLIRNNVLRNSSATAGNETVNISVTSDLVLNANIGAEDNGVTNDNNTFTNTLAGAGFEIDVNSALGVINLDLQDNTAASAGGVQYFITETNGTFNVVDRDDTLPDPSPGTNINNTGTISLGGKTRADFGIIVPPVDSP